MSPMASQITGGSIICSIVCSGADKNVSKLLVAGLCGGIHRWPPLHKGLVTRKRFPFDDVIVLSAILLNRRCNSLQWCHNDHDGVSNHQPRGYLHNRFYSCADQRKHQISASLALCAGNSRGECFHLMTSSCTSILYVDAITYPCSEPDAGLINLSC